METLIKAGAVFSPGSPLLKDGAIAIRGGKIEAVGRASDFSESGFYRTISLGKHIVMPGFVNAHSHLQFSFAKGKMEWEGDFIGWVRKMISLAKNSSDTEILVGIKGGVNEMLETGTTAVGDIVSKHEFASPLVVSGLRCVVFPEAIAPLNRDAIAVHEWMANEVGHLQEMGVKPGISPHGPHTVSGELFRHLSILAGDRSIPFMTHLAETIEEEQFIRRGEGAFRALFDERGGAGICGKGISPVRLMKEYGVLHKMMAVHLNEADEDDLDALRAAGAVPVFCAGSSDWFKRNRVMPFDRMFDEEMHPALGTDSLASNDSLSMLDEIRRTALRFPSLRQESILEAATNNGAKALGLECGVAEKGKWADLIAFPVADGKAPIESIFCAVRPDFVMTGGVVRKNA